MKHTSSSFERVSLVYCVVATTCLLMTTPYLFLQQNNANEITKARRRLVGQPVPKPGNGPPDPKPGIRNGPKYDVVIGSIMMWAGSVDSIPQNWALCNGENNTPDLRDKFVMCAGDAHNVNSVGGRFNMVLSTDDLPAHNHDHVHPISAANINVGLDGVHKHDNIEGDIAIDGDSLRHRHQININSNSQTVNFQGRVNMDVVDIGWGGAGLLNSPGQKQRKLWSSPINNGAHSHRINGYTAWETADEGNITLSTDDLSTDQSVAHKHSVDGVTDTNQGGQIGSAQQIDITNPYYSLCFIMKTTNLDNSLKQTIFDSKNDAMMNVIYSKRGHDGADYGHMNGHVLLYALGVALLLVLTCGAFNVFTFYKMTKMMNGQYQKCDMVDVVGVVAVNAN